MCVHRPLKLGFRSEGCPERIFDLTLHALEVEFSTVIERGPVVRFESGGLPETVLSFLKISNGSCRIFEVQAGEFKPHVSQVVVCERVSSVCFNRFGTVFFRGLQIGLCRFKPLDRYFRICSLMTAIL